MTLIEETLSSENLVSGHLLKAYRDTIRRPDGGTAVREWIDHPGASAVVALLPDNQVLLVRQFRYPPRREFVELPAGKLDSDREDPAAVAARELEEETGWRAGTLVHLGSSYPCIGYSNEVIHFFLARDLEMGKQELEEAEFLEVISMPFKEALQRARSGEFLDMKTTTGLVYAGRWAEEHGEDLLNTVDPGYSEL